MPLRHCLVDGQSPSTRAAPAHSTHGSAAAPRSAGTPAGPPRAVGAQAPRHRTLGHTPADPQPAPPAAPRVALCTAHPQSRAARRSASSGSAADRDGTDLWRPPSSPATRRTAARRTSTSLPAARCTPSQRDRKWGLFQAQVPGKICPWCSLELIIHHLSQPRTHTHTQTTNGVGRLRQQEFKKPLKDRSSPILSLSVFKGNFSL